MVTKVQKWGNSLGLRIPKSFAAEVHIEEGSEVEISMKDGKLVIAPHRKRYRLAALLSKISKKNLHEETVTAEPVGREVW